MKELLDEADEEADDDGEQGRTFDESGGENHVGADRALGIGLAGDRLDRTLADHADTESATDDGEASAESREALTNGDAGGRSRGLCRGNASGESESSESSKLLHIDTFPKELCHEEKLRSRALAWQGPLFTRGADDSADRTHLVGVCVLVTMCTIMLVIFMVVAEL